MKIAIECNSLLLQQALEQFLASSLVTKKHADIIIRDQKNDDPKTFYIAQDPNADLQKPFSKANLLLELQKRLQKQQPQIKQPQEEKKDFALLEKRIHMLTQEYEKNILETIKAFYG